GARVYRRKASACGNGLRERREKHVPRHVRSGVAVTVNASRRQVGRRLVCVGNESALGKHDFIRVDKNVRLAVRVADEVVQAAAVVGKGDELLDRDAAFVFDHALQAAIDVTNAGNDATLELVFRTDHELIRVFHAGSGLEGLATADADRRGLVDAT